MIMKKKNGSPLQKRADFQNYSSREPFWLSFFFSVSGSIREISSQVVLDNKQIYTHSLSQFQRDRFMQS